MYKRIVLLAVILFGSLFESFSQDASRLIIGKWKTAEQYRNSSIGWAEIEYKTNGTFTMTNFFRNHIPNTRGAFLDFIVPITGKYECSGKAISQTFDEVGDFVMKSYYSPDCTLPSDKRKIIDDGIRTGKFKMSAQEENTFKRQALASASGGLFKQVILINYEKMIFGSTASDPETFTRIQSEQELEAAKQKREKERADRAEARRMLIEKQLDAEKAAAEKAAAEKAAAEEAAAEKAAAEKAAAEEAAAAGRLASEKAAVNNGFVADKKDDSAVTGVQSVPDIMAGAVQREGSKLVFADSKLPLSEKDFSQPSTWQDYQKAVSKMNTGKTFYYVSAGALAVAGAGIAVMSATDNNATYTMGMYATVAGIVVAPVCAIAGVVMRLSGKSKLESIVKENNNKITSTMSFGIQPNGIGLAFSF